MNKPKILLNLNKFLANLPGEPGVYRMLNAEREVLYVGKAANLKQRVSSYFVKSNQSAKTRSLINQVADIEVTVTCSETEALLLESSLIKSLRPKYNVLMRDDKSYPYLHLSSHQAFPRMEIVRVKKKPAKGSFFGPYPSASAIKETLGVIQKVFKIRNCSDAYFRARTRPCLQYQIKRCSAPCTGYISEEKYRQSVQDASRFLQGKCQLILKELEARMNQAVADLEFEEAARLRDEIKSLRLVQEQQSMIHLRGDADVIVLKIEPGFACVQWVTIREGEVKGSQSFYPSLPTGYEYCNEDQEAMGQQVFSAFLSYFYVDMPERIPPLILTNHKVEDQRALQTMLSELRGKRTVIQQRARGIKARWIDFALNNLHLAVAEYQTSTMMSNQRYEALAKLLALPKKIKRMECFDVSHTQGSCTVASCVVFDESGPLKSAYRRFNIEGITAGDDYAALAQALERRFKRLTIEGDLPDVLIIDGGKGQVAIAGRVLSELKINGVKLLGIAKGPKRKAGWEQLILADEQSEMTLPADSPALHLLQHIRDEAHRFAITLHRKKRQKISLDSTLESIEGIGAKRRQALLARFGGFRELARAPLEEIAKVPGINQNLAKRIYQHFHS
ncbi:excinuclease ABC subunit UvrC [Legionella londiniensis]|uniref:UvrABC system protein C n=1 Tax=Legionella londiniensis TaxID=45068 RepID=A0A0W0VJQ7_9GAMM|nr:excinuclease ABC subunit UvrC [Legionella londiniensis]KTD20307.1 excinuclease ABC subunit C [Legionella londiniensis]STX93909.1 excinuclease ABC subunit [Legionella londiniensis]